MQPKLSVIIPCYNVGKYLPRLLDSILIQTYDNVEIVCVDDGSTDNTKEVIDIYESRFLEKGYEYICVSQKNAGVCTAINKGLQYIFVGNTLFGRTVMTGMKMRMYFSMPSLH